MQEKVAKICGMRHSRLAAQLDFKGDAELRYEDMQYAATTAWRAISEWMLDFGYEWRRPRTGVGDEEDIAVELVRKLKELTCSLIEAAAQTHSHMFFRILEDAIDKIQMAMCDYDGLAYEDFPDPEECARLLGEEEQRFYQQYKEVGS